MYELFKSKSFAGVIELVFLGLALLVFFNVFAGAIKARKLDMFSLFALLISGATSILMLWLLLR